MRKPKAAGAGKLVVPDTMSTYTTNTSINHTEMQLKNQCETNPAVNKTTTQQLEDIEEMELDDSQAISPIR